MYIPSFIIIIIIFFFVGRYCSVIIIFLHLYCHYNRVLLTIGFGLFAFCIVLAIRIESPATVSRI